MNSTLKSSKRKCSTRECPLQSDILEPIKGWETRNFMRPVRRFVALDKMATNASFRLSEREVTHGTG
jgi:hypothetical protein